MELQNFTNKPVTIPAKTVLCSLQQVERVKSEELRPDVSGARRSATVTTEQFLQMFKFTGMSITPEEKCQLEEFLVSWKDVFSVSEFDIGHTDLIKHRIDLVDETPIKQRHRRIPPTMYTEVKQHIDQMLEYGVIRPSRSPWSSPIVLVRKKDGSLRFCVDYRKLNQVTKKDAYHMSTIGETLDTLCGANYFTCLDLKMGYWQMEVEDSHKERTTSTTRPLGLFEFSSMPFGLCNSLAIQCLSGVHIEQCLI